jgi:hypothetical protein
MTIDFPTVASWVDLGTAYHSCPCSCHDIPKCWVCRLSRLRQLDVAKSCLKYMIFQLYTLLYSFLSSAVGSDDRGIYPVTTSCIGDVHGSSVVVLCSVMSDNNFFHSWPKLFWALFRRNRSE